MASTWMISIMRPFTPPAALMSSAARSMPLLMASSNGASAPVRLFAVPITIGSPGPTVPVSDAPSPPQPNANMARHEMTRSITGRLIGRH